MRYLVILQFLSLLSGCSQEFIDPDTDKDKIDIEVDSTYNEYTVTITF
mgnify:FL=1